MSESSPSISSSKSIFKLLLIESLLLSFGLGAFVLSLYIVSLVVTNISSPFVLGGLIFCLFFGLSSATAYHSIYPWYILFGYLVSLAFFILSYASAAKAQHPENYNWSQMKSQITTKVWPLTLVAIVAFAISSVVYLLKEPNAMMYFLLAVACLSFGMSYGSLSAALINA